jgi:hypothetical protein
MPAMRLPGWVTALPDMSLTRTRTRSRRATATRPSAWLEHARFGIVDSVDRGRGRKSLGWKPSQLRAAARDEGTGVGRPSSRYAPAERPQFGIRGKSPVLGAAPRFAPRRPYERTSAVRFSTSRNLNGGEHSVIRYLPQWQPRETPCRCLCPSADSRVGEFGPGAGLETRPESHVSAAW